MRLDIDETSPLYRPIIDSIHDTQLRWFQLNDRSAFPQVRATVTIDGHTADYQITEIANHIDSDQGQVLHTTWIELPRNPNGDNTK